MVSLLLQYGTNVGTPTIFCLAQMAGKGICPPFSTLRVHNTRTGFFEREDFEAVLAHLPSEIQPVVSFAYLTGWMIQSEIMPLTWRLELARPT